MEEVRNMHSKMLSFFDDLTDPRVDRTKLHCLKDIIGITICAVISGCDDWDEIELYGRQKFEWLKQFLELPNGIPSHDTFNQVFAALNPQELQQCFISWVQSIAQITDGRVVSIDGKRLCNSGVDGKKGFIHMVSAWCNTNNIVLGQVKTDEKSNEITAIPVLLDLLVLEGAIVTIDAMGCQQQIAEKIIDCKADYVLAVKENQAHLLDDIKEAFEQTANAESFTSLEKSHGRIEKRTCKVITDMDWICKQANWKNLQAIIRVESERTILATGQQQKDIRYYIASLLNSAKSFLAVTRQHWGIENKLHWSLDVTFREDYSTKQAGNAAENFSTIAKVALNLLKNNKSKKLSIKKKRLLCSWDNDFLAQTVFEEI